MSTLQIKKHVPSGTVIFQRPERRNALSRRMLQDLIQAFSDFHGEKRVRAVILTGAGAAFSSGLDLSEMNDTASQPDALGQWHQDVVVYQELIETMLRFPKPIIAAVNGPALGAGLGLVLASDLVIAGRDAQFGAPEPRRGLVSGLVAPLLTFRIGGSWAANLLLTGRAIDAEAALRVGLCHEVVAGDLIWARAHQQAEEIAGTAPESVQLTKRLLNETIGEQLSMLLTAGAASSATARTTEAASEGMKAFLEKRPPKWL
ncbi:MAG TPA: enoyl-CoA hydratase/isomerase family protein [Pirellulaceae bacterium]|nr:enoyl-CoA hydratase/isomerase family protein [Pirellulaceae bacterium]